MAKYALYSILGFLILIILINSIRAAEEDYPLDEEDKYFEDNAVVTHDFNPETFPQPDKEAVYCDYGEDLLKTEPCWSEYSP